MSVVVDIRSYFSPTDLASALPSWPVHRDGHEYEVTLRSLNETDELTTRLLEGGLER